MALRGCWVLFMRFRALGLSVAGAIALAVAVASPVAAADFTPVGASPAVTSGWAFAAATEHLMSLRDELIGKQVTTKLPGGLGGLAANYTGNDSCQWANDGECDDPGVGTGACR